MKFVLPTLAALSLALAPLVAEAKPGNGRGNGHGARAEGGFCPPGLAKRNPACIPPGQVGRGDRDDDREARREREEEPDRDDSEREVRAVPPEPDPAAVLLDLLDEMPVREVEPSDAAVLDLPPEPVPERAPVAEPVEVPERALAEEPVADTESDLADVFRRATAEGSAGY